MANKNPYLLNYLITIMLFGLTNILDQLNGQPQMTKNYPFFIYLIWTALVATFLYLGFKFLYWVNAVLLFGVQCVTVFYHPASEFKNNFQWLIGSIPFDYKYMIFIPVFIVISFLVQVIFIMIKRIREQRGNRFSSSEIDD